MIGVFLDGPLSNEHNFADRLTAGEQDMFLPSQGYYSQTGGKTQLLQPCNML
jgi:hypothetical protein